MVYATSLASLPGYTNEGGTLAAFSDHVHQSDKRLHAPMGGPIGFENSSMAGTPIVANGEVYVSPLLAGCLLDKRLWLYGPGLRTAIPLCTPLRLYDNSGGGGSAASPLVVNNYLY